MEETFAISQNPALFYSLGFALAAFFLVMAAYTLVLRKSPLARRLDSISAGAGPAPQSLVGWKIKNFLKAVLLRMAEPAKPKQDWQVSRLRKDLLNAGYRSTQALNIFLGLKVCAFLLFPLLTFLSPIRFRLSGSLLAVALVMAAGVGFLLPNLVLDHIRRQRVEKLDRELPEVLDLLVLAVEAGLGLDAALRRVASELALSSPTLSAELAIVSLELRAGIPRDRALRNLAMRCGVDDIVSLVAMLTQADRFGVSIGRSLRIHSDTVRTKRRQRFEEKATKIPLKLLFPVLFFIFPAIMAIMVGPALISVKESFLR